MRNKFTKTVVFCFALWYPVFEVMHMTMGQLIKAARERAGMTQEELGKKIGVTGVAIMRYEKGQRQPRLAQLQAIASALGVPVQELISDWEAVDKEEFKRVFIYGEGIKDRIDAALDRLNDEGQEKAAERVEELTEIPKYQK
jgi:transcriptional regulator with XRE-family HTH domain